jgi:transposase
MTKRRSIYTKEFKLAILSQIEAGIPLAQVARENGVHPALVSRWKKEFKENPEKAFSGTGQPYKDQARLAELERMVGRLYAENEFLKKTLEKMNERVEEEKRKSQHRSDTK